MRRFFSLLLVLASCATLNTDGMSAQCRDLYNACLNRCPQPSGRVAPGAPIDSLARTPEPGLDIDTASCTKKCNDDQHDCR